MTFQSIACMIQDLPKTCRPANGQVGVEVKNVSKKHYEAERIFFFDNMPDLWYRKVMIAHRRAKRTIVRILVKKAAPSRVTRQLQQ